MPGRDPDPKDSRVSPIYGDVSGAGNLFVLAGTREIIYPDVTEFCQQPAAQGIHARLTIEEGMNRVYPLYPIPEAKAALTEICEFIPEKDL